MGKKVITLSNFLFFFFLLLSDNIYSQSLSGRAIKWDNNEFLPDLCKVEDIRKINAPSNDCYSRIFTLNDKLIYVKISSLKTGMSYYRFSIFSQEIDSCRCVATGLTIVRGVKSAFYYSDRDLWLDDSKEREVVEVQDSIYSDFDDIGKIRWFLAKCGDRLLAIDFSVSVNREIRKLFFWAGNEIIGELKLDDL